MLWIPNRSKPKTHKGEPWAYWQPKLDGWRLTACGQPGGKTLWFGRETTLGTEMSSRIRHCTWFSAVRVPPRCALDGELWVPGKPASYVSSAIANKEQMRFTIFSAYYNGIEILPRTYQSLLVNGCWVIDGCPISTLPLETGTPEVRPDAEGYVLIAEDGTRYKYKTEQTVDLIILDVKAGKGKYSGQVGALICGVESEVCSVSGMDDDVRSKLSAKDIGRVVEIRYQYVGAKGGLRHCRFVRFRDDKPVKEVVWPQE